MLSMTLLFCSVYPFCFRPFCAGFLPADDAACVPCVMNENTHISIYSMRIFNISQFVSMKLYVFFT